MRLSLYAFCALCAILLCSGAPQLRIAGGDDAVLGQLPYQAALFIAGTPTCGATIIGAKYALTALMCVCSEGSGDKPWPPQLFTLTVGTTDLYTGGERIAISEIVVNTNYSDRRMGIALLKFSQPLVFNANIQAIGVAREQPSNGAEVTVSGWGRIKETDDNMYRTLQLNTATVVDEADCRRAFFESNVAKTICLAHPRKQGVCRGDFGGPAVLADKLVGMAGFLAGECGGALPNVFSSMASYYDWIAEQMQ